MKPRRASVLAVIVGLAWASHVHALEPSHPDVVYAQLGGTPLHVDLYLPEHATVAVPVVVHVHGGGWFLGDRYPLPGPVDALLENGIAVASVQYRLSGQQADFGGETVLFPAQIHDVKGAVRWLRANADTYGLDETRIGAWGMSAGGHLAALLGTSGDEPALEGTTGGNLDQPSHIMAAVDYYGPTDLLNANFDRTFPPGGVDHDLPGSSASRLVGWTQPGQGIGDIRAHVDDPRPPYPMLVDRCLQANPITHVTGGDSPCFIAHGAMDTLVPLAQSTKLADALGAAGVAVAFETIVDGIHDFDSFGSVNEAAVTFLINQLQPDTTPPTTPKLTQLEAIDDVSVTLDWLRARDRQSGVSAYVVRRDGSVIAALPDWTTSFTDTGLDELTSYQYTVTARNGYGFESRSGASRSVETLADTSPPGLSAVDAAGDPTRVTVTFDEPIDPVSAGDATHYQLGRRARVLSATVGTDNRSVLLATSPLRSGANYTLAVQGVLDQAINANGATARTQYNFVFLPRVSAGLLAIYDLGSSSGDVVHDVSGAMPPLDLHIDNVESVTWTGDGLRLDQPTTIRSSGAAVTIIGSVLETNELTIEAWALPQNLTQTGPARIVTISADPVMRNVTLGQSGDRYEARVRTTETTLNGTPALPTASGTASTALQHIVLSRNDDGVRTLYIDGDAAATDVSQGTFANWNTSYQLALGNEATSDRPWLGELRLVAVYSRALSAEEVGFNFAAGPDPILSAPVADINADGLVDVDDLIAVILAWGPCVLPHCPADIDRNGVVDVDDLILVILNWG